MTTVYVEPGLEQLVRIELGKKHEVVAAARDACQWKDGKRFRHLNGDDDGNNLIKTRNGLTLFLDWNDDGIFVHRPSEEGRRRTIMFEEML